jgi:hypothetical protein
MLGGPVRMDVIWQVFVSKVFGCGFDWANPEFQFGFFWGVVASGGVLIVYDRYFRSKAAHGEKYSDKDKALNLSSAINQIVELIQKPPKDNMEFESYAFHVVNMCRNSVPDKCLRRIRKSIELAISHRRGGRSAECAEELKSLSRTLRNH